MPAYRSENGMWYASFYYKEINGKNVKKKKTGFATKKEALIWERRFLDKRAGSLNMPFENFVEVYMDDIKPRLRYNTWITKEHVIRQKIVPYFGSKNISEITPADVIKWQNIMMSERSKRGDFYSDTYLRTINNQLSAIFNHALRLYNLKSNPVRKAGGIGKEKTREMLVWAKDEYLAFSEAIKDNKSSYYAFEMLYWCGLRLGELLALTGSDFDFTSKTVSINKSYQRLNKTDYITPPKTEKSNRVITMPYFLCAEMEAYLRRIRRLNTHKRIFTMSRNFLRTELDRGAETADVKKIRIHDLRHSHVSLLISMGFSAVDIAERLGHESINITLHYAHMFPTRQIEMAEKLNSALQKMA